MMLLLLHCITLTLVVSSVNGLAGMAIVPPSPSSAEDSSDCLDTCFRSSALIETAFDLANFQDIARHSNNFCLINTAMKACVALCSEREKRQAVERGRAAEYFCGRRKAVLDRIGKCLSSHSNTSNVVEGCAEDCGLPFGHGPIRLDSSPSAMINPSVFLDGIETTCKREICIIRCSSDSLERMCTEAGKLFRDAARFQIQIGAAKLAAEATSTSQPDLIIHASPPASRPVGFDETQEREFAMQTGSLGDFVHKFIAALPNECRFVYNASDFDKAVDTIDLNAVMAQAHLEEAPFNEGSPFETAELSSDEPLGPPTPAQFRNFTAEEEALKLKELSTISPDVPIGSPDKSGTTESPANMDIVTGQQETDEKIIDMTGHEVDMNMIPTTLPTVSDNSNGNMSADDTDTMGATGRAELQNNEDSMPINTNSIGDIESSQMIKSASLLNILGSLLILMIGYILTI